MCSCRVYVGENPCAHEGYTWVNCKIIHDVKKNPKYQINVKHQYSYSLMVRIIILDWLIYITHGSLVNVNHLLR